LTPDAGLLRIPIIEYGRARMSTFFPPSSGLTVRQIADLTGAAPRDGARLDTVVTSVAALDRARPSDLVFMDHVKYLGALTATRAGVCLANDRFAEQAPVSLTVLRTAQPFRDFVVIARHLFPDSLRPRSVFEAEGVAPGAIVHPMADIENDVMIDPGAVIGPRAAIGSGTVIGSTAVIGPDVQIGRDCAIGPGTSIINALIGDRVILHGGCRIGQDGFRYHPSAKGHVKVPQLGRVVIQDDVEIGANTAVDRGGSGDTVIGEGTKIDNLVQIGHNCTIGRHCVIAAQCGLSGSIVLGDHVMLGGQVGIADHVTIGERAIVAAKSGVIGPIPAGQQWFGYPAMPGRDYLRVFAGARKRT
jgi:UDP-3-O-[3-hydroxymyristoyl] glucosamine N-acyltransferase